MDLLQVFSTARIKRGNAVDADRGGSPISPFGGRFVLSWSLSFVITKMIFSAELGADCMI